jgi:hypothetical protein
MTVTREKIKRNSQRVRRRLKVTLPHCRAFTLDVGSGGFSAELLRVLQPGTKISGVIELDQAAIPFAGTVAWSKPGDPYLGLRGRMGIAFAGSLQALHDVAVTRSDATGR